jgi:hypothetical protein
MQGLSRVLLHLSAISGMSSFILYIGDADTFTYKINHDNPVNDNNDKNSKDDNDDDKNKNDNRNKNSIVKITENSYNKDNMIIRILSKDCHIILPNDGIRNYNYDNYNDNSHNDDHNNNNNINNSDKNIDDNNDINSINKNNINNLKNLKHDNPYLHTQMGGGKFDEALKISFIDNNNDNDCNSNDYKKNKTNNEKNKIKNKAKIHAKIPLQFHEFQKVKKIR